ncbi:MAG: aldo/keto reductase [Polyangiales bacterium]
MSSRLEERRLVLGCMRIPEDRFSSVISAAIAAGIRRFDTARAYGNEHLLAGVDGFVVTKCGMREGWVPDGRARAILEDARASHAALGRPADLLLLHAPDPRTALSTSVRALVEAMREGHARAIGLSNVSLRELDEACAIAEISAVEVALGAIDDAAARNGLLRACSDRSIELLAHSPFGGPKRAARILRDQVLVGLARERGVTSASVFLAYLQALSPVVVPVVGATRPEHVAECAQEIELDDRAFAKLDARFVGLGRVRSPPQVPTTSTSEVGLIMGLAGAGKSTLARTLGGVRLNRDTMGGTLKGVARAVATHLEQGAERVVVDNTYLGRAVRADVIASAHEKGARVRCVFLDTPMHEAQVNVILRMLEKRGRLLTPEELLVAPKEDPNLLAPTALFRMQKELEPPSLDEGFTEIDVVPFVREPWPSEGPGRVIALDLVIDAEGKLAPLPSGEGPALVFGYREGFTGTIEIEGAEVAICTHASGPPRCWCRPPLPGFIIEWAVRRRIDLSRSVLFGATTAHATLARALHMREGSSTNR